MTDKRELDAATISAPDLNHSILDRVADEMAPGQIRDLAHSLLRLADAIDQDWQPPQGKSIFRWPNALSRIERNAYALAERANLEYRRRRVRAKYVPPELLAEPAWDMLLELFQQHAGNARVSTTSLCIASNCPTTTALRYVSVLEDANLIRRISAKHDRRVTFVELTDEGVLAMGGYLSEVS